MYAELVPGAEEQQMSALQDRVDGQGLCRGEGRHDDRKVLARQEKEWWCGWRSKKYAECAG